MKFASRIQPFVSVTRKEADAIEMENKLTKIVQNKAIPSQVKSKLIEDGIGRMNNFKEDQNLAPDVTEGEPAVESTTSTVTIKRKDKKKDGRKTSRILSKSGRTKARVVRKPRNIPRGPVLTFSDSNPGMKPESTHERTDNIVLDKIPSYMRPQVRTKEQKGKGSSNRLYVKKWK